MTPDFISVTRHLLLRRLSGKPLSADASSADDGAGEPPSSRRALNCQVVVVLIAWFPASGANGARPRSNHAPHRNHSSDARGGMTQRAELLYTAQQMMLQGWRR